MPVPKTNRALGPAALATAITWAIAALVALAAAVGAQFAAQAQGETPQEQLELGARLYAENCAVCHGPNGEGRVGATLAKDWPSIRPDLTVRTIIVNGVPGTAMPAWGQANGGPLSEAETEALTAYILSWGTGGAPQIAAAPTNTPLPPITPPPNVEGDPNRGALLFAENCVLCHGEQGEGRIGATLAKDWPGIRPDLAIRATIASGVPGSNMPAWSQANGGPLSEADIDDLVSYILSWENPNAQAQPTIVVREAPPSPFMRSWGGVIVFVLLLAIIFGGIVWLQRRQSQ
jgi:mono/diheme cytochrome c family protein